MGLLGKECLRVVSVGWCHWGLWVKDLAMKISLHDVIVSLCFEGFGDDVIGACS